MDTPIDRILQIINNENTSAANFSKSIGKNPAYISNIKAGTGNFGVDVLMKINKIFPKYSIDWIVTGVGEMLTDEKSVIRKEISDFKHEIDEKFKTILLKTLEDLDVIAKLKTVLQ